MQRTDFSYNLPPGLIAQHPLPERGASRLLHLDGASGKISHHVFGEFLDFIGPDDLLVFNDTRVIPARLWGRKASGGKVEILIERTLADGNVLAHARASKPLRNGAELWLENDAVVTVRGRDDDLFRLDFGSDDALAAALVACGQSSKNDFSTSCSSSPLAMTSGVARSRGG